MSDYTFQIELMRRFIAHDIRQPLMNLQRDAEKCGAALSENGTTSKNKITKRARRKIDQIENILRTLFDDDEAEDLFQQVRINQDRQHVHKRFITFLETLYYNMADCCARMQKLLKFRCILNLDETSNSNFHLRALNDNLRSLRQTLHDFRKLANSGLDITRAVDVFDLLQAIIQRKSLRDRAAFKMNFSIGAGSPLLVNGNPHHLTYVFRQIISNSIKHSGDLQLLIQISGRAVDAVPEVMIDHVIRPQSGNFVFIQFEDTGEGMSTQALSSVREALQRQSDQISPVHRKENGQGMGIGLQICKQVITLYQGKIAIDSVEKSGTSVYFLLPMADGRS